MVSTEVGTEKVTVEEGGGVAVDTVEFELDALAWSWAERQRIVRYQPMLVSGNSRPRGLRPPSGAGGVAINGSSLAQSWERSKVFQEVSSNFSVAWVIPPDLAKARPDLMS
jgi:hypothetical protein